MPHRRESKQSIEIHFQEVIKLSEQIAVVAAVLQRLGNEKMEETVCLTREAWKSTSAEQLIRKEVEMIVQMTEKAVELSQLAVNMEQQAHRMYQAEQTSFGLADVRLY